MTEQAGKPRVIAIIVFELREVSRCWFQQDRMSEKFFRSRLLVTRVAVCGQRCELTFLVVTREAHCVSEWSSLGHFFALRLGVLMAVSAICVGVFVVGE